MKTIDGQTMLSTLEASARMGVSAGTLRTWRHQGTGPKSFRVGKKLVYYLQDDLDEWLRAQYEASVTA